MNNPKNFLLVTGLVFLNLVVNAQPRQGMQAAEIALPSSNGDTLRLSSFKGKVVLIDFWASWCPPCRSANKGFAKLYPKYKDKGFEIYSVSFDENSRDWEKAIEKDKVTWPHVIAPGGWEAATAKTWNIFALPTTYLVDKEGKLVAMDLEKKDLEKALKVLLEE